MMWIERSNRYLSGLAAVFVLLLAGCGGQSQSGISGTVDVDGSSTVYPITEAVAEEFMQEHRAARVTVSLSGTGGGFEKFLRGETDINDASRPIKPPELQRARETGVEFIELPVAYDGLAVVAHPANDWTQCLTTDQLKQIWQPDSEVETWSDVNPDWPDEPITLYGPGTASGTYDYFTEAIVGESGASRTDYTASEDDNVLVQGISGDEYALGYFGLAYYENNQDELSLVGVDDGNPDNGEGCIKPSAQTVENGTYQPLARPLFIYVSTERAANPTVETFVNFYLEHVGDLASDVGYFPLGDEAYELAQNRFEQRVTGSMFEGDVDPVGANIRKLMRGSAGASPGQPAE